jgi:hypothetical protein
MFDTAKAIEGQKKYCQEEKLPHFAPTSGRCYRCSENIYARIVHQRKDRKTQEVIGEYTTGIEVEKASSELITGCPHCNRSYCD